jgi:hypothetical protein
MKRFVFLLIFAMLAGCVFSNPSDLVTPAASDAQDYRGLQLEKLGEYRARFTMSFEGSSGWWYQALLSSDGDQNELQLSLEGLPPSKDPGDVRSVEANGMVKLQGEATGGKCWVFPAADRASVEPLTPDDIIAPASIATELEKTGSGKILGRSADQFTFMHALPPDFSNAELKLWLDSATGAVLRYEIQLSGEDPVFNSGRGTLTGEFEILELGSIVIEPIPGCSSELPLTDDARDLYLLDDFVAYRTRLSAEEVVDFLLKSLPPQGWQEAADTDTIPGTAALSFQRGETALEVFIQAEDTLTEVRFFLAPVPGP